MQISNNMQSQELAITKVLRQLTDNVIENIRAINDNICWQSVFGFKSHQCKTRNRYTQ
jgi:hypothetical protein